MSRSGNLASLLTAAILAFAPPQGTEAATLYQIDIDSGWVSGSDSSGPISTEPGWTSLDVTNPQAANGASVTIDGVSFSVGSADGSRIRLSTGTPTPNLRNADFIFDDGAGQAVILFFGAAGDLEAGTWRVSAYIWDSGVPSFDQATMFVGYRTNSAETIVSNAVAPDPENPAIVFEFESDGVSAYDVFVRENSAQDRARLNAVRLELIPESSTAALCALGFATLLIGRRRR